jgi:hypothetical protein
MAKCNPNGGNDSHILTAKKIDLTSETYKPNIYYVYRIEDEKDKDVYKVADGAFDSNEQYYDIVPAESGTEVKVKFDSYTFKGFDPPGYEGKENPTGVSIKSVEISSYANIYSKDTKNYRMAKML